MAARSHAQRTEESVFGSTIIAFRDVIPLYLSVGCRFDGFSLRYEKGLGVVPAFLLLQF